MSDGIAALTTFRGRLTGIGYNYIHTYVTESSTDWSPTGPILALGGVQNIWQNASGAAARQFDLAYANSLLCAVQTDDSGVVTSTVMTLDGVQISRQQFSPFSSARVVGCGNTFVLVTRTSTGTMAARTLATGSATTFGSSTTLEATVATGTTHWDLADIPGTTDFLITYPRVAAGNIRLRRYTSALALSFTLDVTPSTAIGDLACAANDTNSIRWVYTDGNDLKTRITDASLINTVGPTTLATVVGIRAPGIAPGHVQWVAATTATNSYFYLVDSANSITTSDPAAPNVWGASKPYHITDITALGAAQIVGQISAGSAFSLPFYTACSYNALLPGNVHGVWDYGVATPLNILSASDTGGRSTVVNDGTYYYAATCVARGLEIGGAVPGAMRVVRLAPALPVSSVLSTRSAQRQTAEAGGLLFIAGGNTCTWDGTVLSTASFPDVPQIISVAEDASGSQTALGTYKYVAVYEFIDANGNIVRSAPSATNTTTLTGANNRLIPTVSTPRSAKRVGNGITPRVVLYRNVPGDSVFFRVAESSDISLLDIAATVAINDGVADATAETREVLYIQSQKPLENVAPGAAQFIAVGRDRLIFGGLQDPNAVKFTQVLFPGEAPDCSTPSSAAFTVRLPEPCTGVEAFGESYIAFTEDAIYSIPGAGPQRNGQGEFFPPQPLYADGGCIEWRSIVSCGEGTFFQLDTDKLYILRPGGAVEFIGRPVRDTLASYPVINGAALCSATQRVVFACQSTAGTTGVLLVYDLTRQMWAVDTLHATSVTEFDGRLALVPYGEAVPSLEGASAGTGTGALPTLSIRTGSFKLFNGNGWGSILKIALQGTYLGDSTIEGFISYDDGVTWTTMGTFAATTAALTNPVSGSALVSGDPITAIWTPKRRDVDRFALRFDMTNSTNTGGSRLHMISLEVEGQTGITRQPARNQR